MQLPSPPSPTLPNHDPPPSSVEERRSQPPSGHPPPPAASSSSQAGGPKEEGLNAEAPPAYTASADVGQGEATLENRQRRPFERVNRRQRPPPLQQQHAPPPPPQMAPSGPPLPPPGMRLVNVSYQHQRHTGRYRLQYQRQYQPHPPRSTSPPVSSANIPPAPPQHPHSRTTTQPPGRPTSPPSTSSDSSGTTTPVSDFERHISDFARDISDFARDFYAAGASGGPTGSSFSPSASPSARTGSTINVIHQVTRDQNHSFAFSFGGIAWAFFSYLVNMVYGRPSTLPDEDGEGISESSDDDDNDDLPSWAPGHPDPPSWVEGHPDPPSWVPGHPDPPFWVGEHPYPFRWNNHARGTEFHSGTNRNRSRYRPFN
ncbi:hypothetical protein PILCRDRAFT_84564 [Piloderma croceum F 1598]|uniref:Uncharacterized protein n=1 Tax=Piloderma croceum (strain F 1598) TaxID=765440 RepID=A0A0C3FZ23_PILCF|nr:hypothetical protein PILCRDRAFT_84564 [Piloderma croceum F 1598]